MKIDRHQQWQQAMIKIYTGYKILIKLYINQVNYRCINYLFTDVQIKFIKYELNYSSIIINQLIKINTSRIKYLILTKIINWSIKVYKWNELNYKRNWKSTNLWILTAVKTYLLSFFSGLSIWISSTPGACQKVVVLPLYMPWKGVDQDKEGQGQSLVDLGTASQGLMDRECVTKMSSLYWTSLIS